MSRISDILNQTSHRPWPLPKGSWKYYQEWREVLFVHWETDPETVHELIPYGLDLDLFEGKAYVSLVAFTVEDLRPKFLPPFPPISDFHELNLRTYVRRKDKPGVYFLHIEAQKQLSVLLSRFVTGLPYEKASMKRKPAHYTSINAERKYTFEAAFTIARKTKSDIDKWLTERYAVFLDRKKKLYCFDIHHKEWEINALETQKLVAAYEFPGLDLFDKQPDHMHHSAGVDVLIWKRIAV